MAQTQPYTHILALPSPHTLVCTATHTVIPTTSNTTIAKRLRSLQAPEPMLSNEQELLLTERQRKLLVELTDLFGGDGFADKSMADLSKQLRCSLSTLYAIAPTRDELILIVVDRHLRAAGDASAVLLTAQMSAIESLRVIHSTGTVSIQSWSPAFARDLRSLPSASRLARSYDQHMTAISAALLDAAVEANEIAAIDTAAVANMIGQIGQIFTEADVMVKLEGTPKDAADEMLDIILCGLCSPTRRSR